MLTTIKGTYSNGVVVLDEQPPNTKTSQVIVTFMEETTLTNEMKNMLDQRLNEDPETYISAQSTIEHLNKKYGL
jgi:hypothetical protein